MRNALLAALARDLPFDRDTRLTRAQVYIILHATGGYVAMEPLMVQECRAQWVIASCETFVRLATALAYT